MSEVHGSPVSDTCPICKGPRVDDICFVEHNINMVYSRELVALAQVVAILGALSSGDPSVVPGGMYQQAYEALKEAGFNIDYIEGCENYEPEIYADRARLVWLDNKVVGFVVTTSPWGTMYCIRKELLP